MRKLLFVLCLISLVMLCAKAQMIVTVVGGGPSTQGEIADTVVYYVDEDSGDNANDGLTTGNAWATLSYADSNIVTGSNPVIVALDPRDTWSLSSTLSFTASGTADDERVIWDGRYYEWSQPSDTATIENASAATMLLNMLSVEYLTLQNLVIDGNSQGDYGIFMGSFQDSGDNDTINDITIQYCDIRYTGSGAAYAPGIFIRPRYNETDNIIIRENRIRYTDAYGIGLYPSSEAQGYVSEDVNDVLITGNIIENYHMNASENGAAIILRNGTDSVTIEHNTIGSGQNNPMGISIENVGEGNHSKNIIIRWSDIDAGSGASAISLSDGGALTLDIYGNILKSADPGGDGYRGCVKLNGSTWTGAEIPIYNNTMICGDNSRGVYIWDDDYDTISIVNNIIYSNDGGACIMLNSESGIGHSNNCIYKTGSTYTITWVSAGGAKNDAAAVQTWEATAQVTDPTFTVDFSNLNLQTGSPAIDNGGTTIAGYTVDMDDVAVGSPPNIGAKETTEDP